MWGVQVFLGFGKVRIENIKKIMIYSSFTQTVMRNIKNFSEIIIYKTEDGQAKVNVYFERETAWLTQKLIADLFEVSIPTANEHLKNILRSNKLNKNSVIRKFLITAEDGKKYHTKHYNLDVIIALGYRVNSKRATQFRIWVDNIIAAGKGKPQNRVA